MEHAVRQKELAQPLFDLRDRPEPVAAPPEPRRQLLHNDLLVVRLEVVLAGVPHQPGTHHMAVKRQAGDSAPLRLPHLDLFELARDQAQRVGPLGHFAQVVDGVEDLDHARGVLVRERVADVVTDLLLVERQQQERAVVLRPDIVPLLGQEVVILFGQGAEVVGAAVDQQTAARPGFRLRIGRRQDAVELACEPLSGGVVEMHQDLVEAVPYDERVVLLDLVDDVARRQAGVALPLLAK